MLQQGLTIPKISVRNAVRIKQRAYIGNLAVPLLKQIVRNPIHPIKTVRNHRITLNAFIIKIKADEGHFDHLVKAG